MRASFLAGGLFLGVCLCLCGCGSGKACSDVDGDRYGVGADCLGPDCDDSNPNVHPQASEVPYDGFDNDCDPATRDDDLDSDGYPSGVDCRDDLPGVHPGATEVVYDGLDNDCDPATPDEDPDQDEDQDGYSREVDCDDHDPTVFPGAVERCHDGVDQDCDGFDATCDRCPDISGTYDVVAYCIAMNRDPGEVVVTQTGCNVAFSLDLIDCTGVLDGALNLYVGCAGLGLPCSGKASLTSVFRLVCSAQCTFLFEPIESRTPCAVHYDPSCAPGGELCGIVGENGSPRSVCVDANPLGRAPGQYCDAAQNIYCANSLCIQNTCGAICADDTHCDLFDGTSCQTVLYNDGQGTIGNIQVCLPTNPGETRCGRSPDCVSSRVCSYRQTDDDVITVCRPPNPGGRVPGEACRTGAECANDLCLCGANLCDGSAPGVCSAVCRDHSDCIQTSQCGSINVPDALGRDRNLFACKPDPNACGLNADCPAGRSCQVFLSLDGLSLVTECIYGAGPGSDNTGDPCNDDTNCFSVWCNQTQNYCQGVCISDADCPAFADNPTACPGGDADCNLEQLCYAAGHCTRPYECATSVFWLGFDQWGWEVYDTVNLCRPFRRQCDLNQACRSGEACVIEVNKTATAARYVCYPGQGPGQLGADCDSGGSGYCWTGLCLLVGGGGPGNAYCSQACVTAADCGSLQDWDCQAIRVDIRPGFVSYVPTCVRL